MRTFAQRSKANHQTTSEKSKADRSPGERLGVRLNLQTQRTIGNQAVSRLLQRTTADPKAGPATSEAASADHNLKQTRIQPLAGQSAETNSIIDKPTREHKEESGGSQEVESVNTSSSSAMVKLPSRGMVHPIAASLVRPGVRFRLPKFERLKAAYTDPDLKIPEAVIKARVTQLLQRMEKDGRLKSKESVATIVAKIFPAAGKIDEAEFNNAIDVKDRTKIYESVAEADTTVKAADKPKLQTAMKDAADLAKNAEANAAGLTEIFGTKAATAKAVYGKAKKELTDLPKSLDAHVTTDYNLDDPEVGLGGWATHADKKMHLLLDVAKVTNEKKTKATLVHEATHFADSSVTDHVYYAKSGFFELDEAKKVANAAHYEELPRREMGSSSFDKKTFTPGVKPGGGALTREDKVKASVELYMRKAWDAGVDAHTLIRGVRRKYQAGESKPFKDNQALILEISKLMDLTIHEQAAGHRIVTMLDVTLSESVSRGVAQVRKLSASIPFPPVGALTDLQLRDKIVADAVTSYGNLLKDAKRDKDLLDWLEAHYHLLPEA